jgi:hypothetical protein
VDAVQAIVMNAGPATVDLEVWDGPFPKNPPRIVMRMPPGNTRSVTGLMIGVRISDDQSAPAVRPGPPPAPFAAVAWRMV